MNIANKARNKIDGAAASIFKYAEKSIPTVNEEKAIIDATIIAGTSFKLNPNAAIAGSVINAITKTIPTVFTSATIAKADKIDIKSSKKKALPPFNLNKFELKHDAIMPLQKHAQHKIINKPSPRTK